MKSKVICKNCGIEFEKRNTEIRRSKNHFCSRSCAATYNNIKYGRCPNTARYGPKKHYFCQRCGAEVAEKRRKFCSGACSAKSRRDDYIKKWLAGEVDATTGKGMSISISHYVRHWLLEENNHKCSKCGWAEVHSVTKKVPLQINHIDGNSKNSTPDNLEVVCPNCHSLTTTFGSLNPTGKGRRTIDREV